MGGAGLMARTHGRIMAAIWSDGDFIAMRCSAQRLFMFLLSQPDLSHAGLIPMRVNRWAKKAVDTTARDVRAELDYLAERGFLIVDDDTEEVLVRTFVRNDGVYKQPRVMDRMREDARQIESSLLRAAFRTEIGRLPLDELSAEPGGPHGDKPSTRKQVERVVTALLSDFKDPSERVSETLPHTPRVGAHAPHLPPTPVPHPPSTGDTSGVSSPAEAADADPGRPDVDRICEHLADAVAENGSKRPTVTKTWRDEARRMLDIDGRSEVEVIRAIDWCQRGESARSRFWRPNVMSMPKLREKYDQMRLQAAEESRPHDGLPRSENMQAHLALVRELEAQERGETGHPMLGGA